MGDDGPGGYFQFLHGLLLEHVADLVVESIGIDDVDEACIPLDLPAVGAFL